ncbi:hypothetical protein DRJ16_07645 [Candidatus Woesearchaeota archaeon]|nr:MAG: hypothetical protein DRJ16_07645 [Candidatus Woesearchaeota archaeon]
MTEKILQQSFVSQFRVMYPAYQLILSLSGTALHGTAQQRSQTVAQWKREGFETGIADLTILAPHGVSIHLELKKPGKGVQSKEQKAMQAKLESLGHHYYLVDNLPDMWQAIANHTTTTDRLASFNQLFQQFSGETALSQPFLFYTSGTSIESIKSDFRPLYHLE